MKLKAATLGWAASLILAGSSPALAETTSKVEAGLPLVARIELMQLSDEAMEKIQDRSRLKGGLTEGNGVRLLQCSEMLMVTDQESQIHFGQKFPIIYFDPRGSQFQVNFVDTGGKLDIRCRKSSADTFQVDLRTEVSEVEALKPATNPPGGNYPQTSAVLSRSTLEQVSYDEGVAVLRLQGQAARLHLSSLGIQSGGDNLIVLVTLTRPQ